jgi:hypothetical protein
MSRCSLQRMLYGPQSRSECCGDERNLLPLPAIESPSIGHPACHQFTIPMGYSGCRVCMYVCMYVSMYIRMYACMYVCTYVCMHACVYVCMYVCITLCMRQLQSVSLNFSFSPSPPGHSSCISFKFESPCNFFCSLAYRILKNSLKVQTSSF